MGSMLKRMFYRYVFLLFNVLSAQAQEDLTLWQKKAAGARKLLNSQPRESLKIAQQYMEAASANRDERMYADAHYLMGQVYLSLGEYAIAFQTLQKGLNYLNSKNTLSDDLLTIKADLLQATGTAYRMWGMWPEAMEAYVAALAIDRAQKNQYNIARTLNNMGVLFEKMDDTLQSVVHYRQALAQAEQIGNQQLQAAALGNIAIYYKNQKNYPLAIQYQMQSLALKKQNNDLRGIANSLGNIGIIYSKQKRYAEALQYTHQTRVIYEQMGDVAMLANTLGSLGDYHLEENNLDSADYYLQQSFEAASARQFLKLMQSNSESLSRLAAKRGAFRTALQYRLIADSVSYILFNKEKQQLTEQAKARYNLQQQQTEITRLQWETRLQEMNNERQAKIISLLQKEAKMTEIIAEKRQLELSLLNSEKKLLEQEQQRAAQQLREQQSELKLQKMQNAENQLKISLQTQQIAYNRLLIVAGVFMFLFVATTAYIVIKRTRQKLKNNQQRHSKILDEIAYINSHQMRAPVATLLGLMNLIKMDMEQGIYNPHLIELVDKTVQKMDEIVRQVSDRTNQISAEEKAQDKTSI